MKALLTFGYLCIPLAFVVHFAIGKGAEWEPIVTFMLAGLGVLPLAHLMGEATEKLAERAGPTWGGLLNATFGNAAELIIAAIALTKGLNEVVKASLTGSILGNLLLVGGASMVAGGLRRERQRFSIAAAEANGGLLALAVGAMLMPAIFHFTGERMHDKELAQHDHDVSMWTSLILLVAYALGLWFTLKTHRHVFTHGPHGMGVKDEPSDSSLTREAGQAAGRVPVGGHVAHDNTTVSIKRPMIMLLIAAGGIGLVAELLVGSAEAVAGKLGWNHVFVGIIVLAIIGNAAEHSTAILMAHRDDMDTAMTIVYQSSLQIALFVTPLLVLFSAVLFSMGGSPQAAGPLDLVFSPLEVASVVLCVAIVIILGLNGETNWFEGALLLALYLILAVVFYHLPATEASTGHS